VTQLRIKEIGVRRVLGASAPGLLVLLSKPFLQQVAIAVVLAVPITYTMMQAWLANFAYRVEMGPTVFLIAGGATLAIAMLTMSRHVLHASTLDPASVLRRE
jgi:putative ABC transport system permease protein